MELLVSTNNGHHQVPSHFVHELRHIPYKYCFTAFVVVVLAKTVNYIKYEDRSRVSSVSIVSDYGLDDWAKDFSSILCVQTGSGARKKRRFQNAVAACVLLIKTSGTAF
jgi:hypothetical protein